MKLGTQTASVINHLQARGVVGQPEPELGMGATLLSWTDRDAGTIVEIFQVGKLTFVTVQDDSSKVVKGSGMDGSAEYEFTPNPNGCKRHFRREEGGMWSQVRKNDATGRWVKTNGQGLKIGVRDKYRDPSF